MVRAGDIIDETADMDIFQVSCLMELANFTFPPPTDELIANFGGTLSAAGKVQAPF